VDYLCERLVEVCKARRIVQFVESKVVTVAFKCDRKCRKVR